ncbi:hypothetical protein H0H81_005078, partial [Sphagnurus paluster]
MAEREAEKEQFKEAADPGTFDGTRTKFAEWRTRAKAWIRVQDNWSKSKVAITVWKRLQGGHTGQFGMARLQQCMDKEDEDPLSDPWPTTKALFEELTLHFQVISERDYAHHKIGNFKEGTMRVDDFMVENEALVAKSGIKDQEQTVVDLLERNTNQEIIKELFKQGHRKTTGDATSMKILQIGQSME